MDLRHHHYWSSKQKSKLLFYYVLNWKFNYKILQSKRKTRMTPPHFSLYVKCTSVQKIYTCTFKKLSPLSQINSLCKIVFANPTYHQELIHTETSNCVQTTTRSTISIFSLNTRYFYSFTFYMANKRNKYVYLPKCFISSDLVNEMLFQICLT